MIFVIASASFTLAYLFYLATLFSKRASIDLVDLILNASILTILNLITYMCYYFFV